jgi:hypothetical protein
MMASADARKRVSSALLASVSAYEAAETALLPHTCAVPATHSCTCCYCFVARSFAFVLQVELTASDWDECGTWLTALKRLIKIRQSMG